MSSARSVQLPFAAAIAAAYLSAPAAHAEHLVITTDGQPQEINVTIGPVPGDVQIEGLSGYADSYSGITSIDLTTGNAQDFVEFRVLATVVPHIRLNTRGGNSDVKFIYELPTTQSAVSTSVAVLGGTLDDKVDFQVESRAARFIASWRVSQGAGNNETNAAVHSPEASDFLSVALNTTATTGQDKVNLSVVSDSAETRLNVNGSLGSNQDSARVAAEALSTGTINLSSALDLGAGQDVAEVEVLTRGGFAALGGSLRGGADLDALIVKVESDAVVNLTSDGGAGNDLIDYSLKGYIEGTPRLLGGDGNDELKLIVDGPRVATPFIDGGPGYDIATGFGTIINVEEIK